MTTRLEAARDYISRGWRPLPIPSGTKAPNIPGWTNYLPEPWTLDKDFGGEGNCGLLLGQPSKGLTDIDLDAPQTVSLASTFLPPTPTKHGRRSSMRSHWWYRVEPEIATKKFKDIDGSMLVEIRSTGCQTVVFPSIHPDTSEPIEWEGPLDPAVVGPDALSDSVAELASAALVARHWPKEGARHEAALALSGVLGRAQWPVMRIHRFMDAVTAASGDREFKDRARAVKDTLASQAAGKNTTGIPSLKALLGGTVVDRLLEWLRITPQDTTEPEPEEAAPPTLAEAMTLSDAIEQVKAGKDLSGILRAISHRVLAGDLAETMARPALAAASGRPDFDELWAAAMEDARLFPPPVPTLTHKDPQKTARAFLRMFHLAPDGTRLLHRHREEFFRWHEGAYYPVSGEAVHKDLATFMEAGRCKPSRSRLADAEHLLRCECHIPENIEPPAWIGPKPEKYPDYTHLVPMRSGILAPDTQVVHPLNPRLFNLSALPFDYDPADAKPPSEWLTFLRSVWPEDPQSIDTLQEMFGYLLTPDTSMQKMFIIEGPRRCGKGTIARVLRRLLGEDNCAGPSLSSLGTNFGCSSLIGKTCAIIADARTSAKTDTGFVCDRLLAITGEDAIDIDRKHKSIFTTQLKTRIIILCNFTPRIVDPSNALSGRFVMMRTTESFYGKEDQSLLGRLLPELPKILHWALEGRRRLYDRGWFVMPESAKPALEQLERESNPVSAFVADKLKVGAGLSISSARLYDLYLKWCVEQGIGHPLTLQTLGKDLRAGFPDVETDRRRLGAEKVTLYLGLGED